MDTSCRQCQFSLGQHAYFLLMLEGEGYPGERQRKVL